MKNLNLLLLIISFYNLKADELRFFDWNNNENGNLYKSHIIHGKVKELLDSSDYFISTSLSDDNL